MMHTDLYHKLGVVILSVENDDATRVALKGAFRSVKTYQHKCAKQGVFFEEGIEHFSSNLWNILSIESGVLCQQVCAIICVIRNNINFLCCE